MSNDFNPTYFESSDKTVRIWIEQGTSIQIKCVSDFGDPVELSVEEAREIAETLRRFANRIK